MRTLLSTTLAALCVLSFTQAAGAGQRLRFTAIPDENTARLKERFDKVADYLSEKTASPWNTYR